jgi:hypothetical protein
MRVFPFVLLVACSSAPEPAGVFQPAADDEALDPSDPPLDPDPAEVLSSKKCGDMPDELSPKGLTFVLHVSKDKDNAAREVKHLKEVKSYLRQRDVFMIEHGSPAVAELRDTFPCNRFHYIAYPDEMAAALATGDGISGIAVDWEGAAVDSHGLGWSVDRLHAYAVSIHKQGKKAAFVPSWNRQSSDAEVTDTAKMNYALAQIQGSCVTSADAFASYARSIANDFHARGNLRNVGFEISMDSYASASNHVSEDRAAACTRKAYGKGARAIYIYGNGHDHLPAYFHDLDQMGVRAPR